MPAAKAFSYFYHSLLFGGQVKEAKQVLKNIGQMAGDDWLTAFGTMVKASGLHPPPPKARLAFYLTKPATWQDALMRFQTVQAANNEAMAMGQPTQPLPVMHSWESYRARFPREYEASWQDFQKLQALDAEGKLKT